MNPFDLLSVPRVAFGPGRSAEIGRLAAEFGRRALIVTNADRSDPEAPVRLANLCAQEGLTCFTFSLRGEPTTTTADQAAALARQNDCAVLIALGGGAALDAAKAAAALLTNGGEALDYLEVVGRGQKIVKPAAPWLALPTTAGTGAEATFNAVLSSPAHKRKASLRSLRLLPQAVILDPELGRRVRREVAARAGLDALTQLIEGFVTLRASPATDALAREGLSLAAHALKRMAAGDADDESRSEMALAAFFSGVVLANAGLGAVHGFAAPLGARLDLPHGGVCAALLPHVLRANVEALRQRTPTHPALRRLAEIGRLLTGNATLNENAAVEAAADVSERWARDFGLPNLGACGLTEADFPEIVADSRRSGSMRGNPVELTDEELKNILAAAI
jgi:alcohol dehydrogenase class IV